MRFSGFPRNVRCTPVPDPLLGILLAEIDDLTELKVTLRGLWLLAQQSRFPRTLTQQDFLDDVVLLQGLQATGSDAPPEIVRGLRLAVARGTFLCCQGDSHDPDQRWYLLNTETDRNAMIRNGWPAASPTSPDAVPGDEAPSQSPTTRPNIFALYEDNIGTIGPMLAEELKDAEERYPWAWISEAFRIAVQENKLSWRYIAAILRRWAAEGKSELHRQGRKDGEPGRYSKKDNRQRYLEDYQRRWGGTSR